MNIYDALASLKATKGFSFNINTGELNPRTGFMVAVSKDQEKIVSNIARYKDSAILEDIKSFCQENAEKLADHDNWLGGWIEKGSLFLDVSEIFYSRSLAEIACRQRDQLAYFDNKLGEAIFI